MVDYKGTTLKLNLVPLAPYSRIKYEPLLDLSGGNYKICVKALSDLDLIIVPS